MNNEYIFFVYGTLKKNFYNHIYLENAEFLGNFTTEPIYNLFDGGFPIVERNGETSIKGELYRLEDKNSIENIFNLEGCFSKVQHDKRNWYDYDYIETPFGKAIIFVMEKGKSGRENLIKSGNWK